MVYISFTDLSFLQLAGSGFTTMQSIYSSDDLLEKVRKTKTAYWLTSNHIDIFMHRGKMSARFAYIFESARVRMITKYPLRAGTSGYMPPSLGLETTRPCPHSNDPIWTLSYGSRQVFFVIGGGLACINILILHAERLYTCRTFGSVLVTPLARRLIQIHW